MKLLNLNTKKNLILILLSAVVFHSLFTSVPPKALLNITALEIIVGGICLSILISFPFYTLMDTLKIIKNSIQSPIDYEKDILKLYDLSIKVKKDGLLGVSAYSDVEEDIFLRDCLVLLRDYKNTSSIENVIIKDIESRKMNLYKPISILKMISHVSPAFGLIGTLLGLIGLLSNMGEVHMIITNMASALVSTLYGSLIANFIATPLMGRVKNYIDHIILRYTIIKEGILSISDNNSPRDVFDKMNVMLKEDKRLDYPTRKGANYERLIS
ncbi:MAG: MotA/TolQ/ExbB proton channel family protein [Anaeromicrobium sp.]|jgi:chemotaxis protein MotA|uniref:motility protein A n=1 Tax=Anaeromicrobium sp. TaxID=1929132 RepID=UPI0025FA7046|nr:MotA/TolQ/ExbB proton channel family protein [Anaeromicrobium sp.]MCT4592925.1 MotA/TolQ/ExbB proton channel family protein [Anaeromicrobium sp.]